MAGLSTAALEALVQTVPFAEGVPLTIAVYQDQLTALAQGNWPDGSAVLPTDKFYAASLAKQITGAAIAVLVRQERLDPMDKLGQFISDLPDWLQQVTLLQVLGHLASLPAAGDIERQRADENWTSDDVLAALRDLPRPANAPGTQFSYANAGYVLLARIVEHAAAARFAGSVKKTLFNPLALADMAFSSADAVRHFPQSAGMGPSLPLTQGDGGLWTTASEFVRWLTAQNSNVLGIADLVERPARLSDGTEVDYGWGIGLRTYREAPLFSHGGNWRGACCKAVRSPALGMSIAVLVGGVDEQENVGRLVDLVLDSMDERVLR